MALMGPRLVRATRGTALLMRTGAFVARLVMQTVVLTGAGMRTLAGAGMEGPVMTATMRTSKVGRAGRVTVVTMAVDVVTATLVRTNFLSADGMSTTMMPMKVAAK